ncbi:hypothetical protein [Mucilaginibacter psychrotolerans]|uniref:Uncharacterized protein n=1 Tax=Mucilaginibacter psychrotolerans TaxID=1524096 RepID=A0A4Y8S422_9SPHI|nr:hypothetical protein [Mucilaginibacter psychrotolerans]TFF33699.1 hypothetical protein E2R66_24825 [Mucilaginibacter psychrotolerans]
MISTEVKKLHLIESLIKENNEIVLREIEKILAASNHGPKNTIGNFVNVLSSEELDAFERNIEEGCEQINEDDWK